MFPITQLIPQYQRLQAGGSSALTIADADLSDGSFSGVAWEGLTFSGCVFSGSGNVSLSALSNCSFIDCRFLSPRHDPGVMSSVRFTGCQWMGPSVFCGHDGSSGVVFEGCQFSGEGGAPESFEGIGCTGDVVFRGCSGSGQVLVAGTQVTMEQCNFGPMTLVFGRPSWRGSPLSATVHINACQGTGLWQMMDGRIKTSRIHDSRFERISYRAMEGVGV